MPRDDEAGQVFDVSKPNRTSPDPTSRPIIVGHQPMMTDPMVKDQSEASGEPPVHPPVAEHRTITVHAPDANDDRAQPMVAPPVHSEPPAQPAAPLAPPAPAEPSVPAAPAVAPVHPESVKAASAGPDADQAAATTPPGDLHLIPVDDLIGHNHHGNPHHSGHGHPHTPAAPLPEEHKPKAKGKGSNKALWILLALIILVVGSYLAIDSRVVKTSIKLPFHVFKQPAVVVQPVAVPTTNSATQATAKATDPYANWKIFVLSNEKLTFLYPPTWTIKDNTASVNDKGDSVTISGQHNFEMTINTGLENYNLPTGGATLDFADPLAFLAQQGYMDFVEVGKQNTGTVSFVNLSLSKTDPTAFPATKNIASSNIKVSFHYLAADGKTVVTKSASFIKTDPNYVDAKLMLQSMHY